MNTATSFYFVWIPTGRPRYQQQCTKQLRQQLRDRSVSGHYRYTWGGACGMYHCCGGACEKE